MDYDAPSPYLDKFNGTFSYAPQGEFQGQQPYKNVSISNENFVCRGTMLRNPEYVVGVCTYTGMHTKIMLNSCKSRAKQSQVERNLNKQIVLVFCFQMAMCFCNSLYHAMWMEGEKEGSLMWQMGFDVSQEKDWSFEYNLVIRFGNWLLLFT